MESNHRFLRVKQVSSPLDHRTILLEWTYRELHPDLRRAEPMSSCWTMSPCPSSGSRETRTRKRHAPPAVFKTASSSCRMTSVKLRELESNQRPPSSEPGVTTNSNYPASFLFQRHTCLPTVRIELRGQDSNLRTRGSKPRISTDRNYPASVRVPCGSRTHLAGLEDRNLCRSAKGTVLIATTAFVLQPRSSLGGLSY